MLLRLTGARWIIVVYASFLHEERERSVRRRSPMMNDKINLSFVVLSVQDSMACSPHRKTRSRGEHSLIFEWCANC